MELAEVAALKPNRCTGGHSALTHPHRFLHASSLSLAAATPEALRSQAAARSPARANFSRSVRTRKCRGGRCRLIGRSCLGRQAPS
eukprot:2377345-Pleurochrysis_carterae.AAC.1